MEAAIAVVKEKLYRQYYQIENDRLSTRNPWLPRLTVTCPYIDHYLIFKMRLNLSSQVIM